MGRGRWFAAALAATLWLATGADAQQQVAAPLGDFGGGAVVPGVSPFSAGNMVIALNVPDAATVHVTATIVGACASGTFYATVPVAPDATFTATGDVRQARTRMRYELRGTLTETPSGTVTARFERTTSRSMRSCGAVDVVWEARRPLGEIGRPGAAVPGATLLGRTEQRANDTSQGIALRISPDGRAVSRAIYGVRLQCTQLGQSPTFDLPRGDLPIGPDGRVSDVESGTVSTQASILKYVERFSGTVGSTGAEGVLSAELSVRRRSTGRRVTLCRSGDVHWSATR